MKFAGIYLAFVNMTAFVLFGIDKWKAVHHRYRIRESVLLGVSAAGGALGGLLAMHLFRHKTQKPGFAWGIPVMLVIWAGILLWAVMTYWKG